MEPKIDPPPETLDGLEPYAPFISLLHFSTLGACLCDTTLSHSVLL
jgi:hypothetical protein